MHNTKSEIDKFEPYVLNKDNFDKDRKVIWIFLMHLIRIMHLKGIVELKISRL